jgi:PKD repeat protein
MKKCGLFLSVVFVFLWVATSHAVVRLEVTCTRGTGGPVTETFTFMALGGPATLALTNGGLENPAAEKVSSSTVAVNGEVIFRPSDFNRNVDYLEKETTLVEGQNTLEVLLKSKPGGQVTIQIIQGVPPCISITNPVDNSTITSTAPYVTIEYSDEDSDLNPSSLNVQINGADHTSYFEVTDTRATCQLMAPLASGSNTISASISDNAGNTSTADCNFTVGLSTEPVQYIFSVSHNDWIFASPGDGTCLEYLSPEDLGLLSFSDVVALSRVMSDGNVFFALSGRGGILQSPADGSNSVYFDNFQLGLEDDDQIAAEHTGPDGSAFFVIDGQPGVYESSGDDTHSFFVQNTQLGLDDSVQVQCLHLDYDGQIYFCRSDDAGVFQSIGDGTNMPFLTTADLGVPGSIIDAFAILRETVPPTITITNPSDGSTIDTRTPNIQISYSDSGSGIDPSSFAAEINGVDKTSLFTVTSTGANCQLTAPLPVGENEIVARIRDNAGNEASATSDFAVQVFDVAINATPTKGGIPLEVQFSAEIVGGVLPYTYEWDLNGDWVVDDTREAFSYVYQVHGIYSVTLTVEDNTGEAVSDTITIYALSAPTVIASASPTSGGAPLDVTFLATVSDPDGTIVLYEWDFDGDGTYDYSDPTTASTTFTYGPAGLYHATIRVTDNDDLTGTDTITLAVGSSPSASATAAPMTGSAPLEVALTGTGTDSDGTISLYEWDFDGNGTYDWSSTTTGYVTYTYASAGIFNATFRVTDNDGLIDTDSVLISVSGPPISKPGAFPTSGEAPLKVTFFSNGEDLDGSPEYYDWDFNGDGKNDRRLIASMNTTYTYTQAGTYNATLIVTDNEGLTGTASVTITVTSTSLPKYPTAIAMANPSNGGVPLQVALSGKGSDEDGTITKLEWDFEGDGVFDFEDAVIPGSTLGNILDVGSWSSPDFVDIDADGDLDMFVGEYYGRIHFYRNDGDTSVPDWTSVGYVTDSASSTIDTGYHSSPELVDIDGDGDVSYSNFLVFDESVATKSKKI